MLANTEIREEIKRSYLKYWEVADRLNISAVTFTVWLRHELPKEKKQLVLNAIRDLKNESVRNC